MPVVFVDQTRPTEMAPGWTLWSGFPGPVSNNSQTVRINPQNSRNLGFETGEPLLSVVVGVPSGDVALDRIDRASKETTSALSLGYCREVAASRSIIWIQLDGALDCSLGPGFISLVV